MSEHYNVSNVNLEAYGLSVTGQVRKANEDSCGFATVPNGDLFVVCDGMGGHVGGATASKIAVEQIIQHFKAQRYENVYQALADALCRANIQILGEAAANPSLKGMGTTACIVLVSGNDAYIAHVGDSRIYLYEAAKKRLFRITKDHSFVQSLVDLGQLDDRDAEHHPRKNVIMKALGTKETLKPEVYESPVQPAKGDMFLICSDGLSGMVDDNGIEAILSSNASIEEKTDQLVANANVPGKGLDNITAQLIKVIDSPYPSSNHPDHNPRWRNELFGEVTQPIPDVPHTDPVYNMAPPQTKKRMSPKLLALIIVGTILLLGGAGVFFNYFFSNLYEPSDPKKIEQRIAKYDKEIKELDSVIGVLDDTIASLGHYVKSCRQKQDTTSPSFGGSKRLLENFKEERGKKQVLVDKIKGKRGALLAKLNEMPSKDSGGVPGGKPNDISGGSTGGSNGEAKGGGELEKQQYTITAKISSMQSGTIRWDVDDQQGTSIQGAIQNGIEITLTAEPKEGFDFISWTVNDTEVSKDANFTFTVTADSTLVANFQAQEKKDATKQFTIKVSANPPQGGKVKGGGTYNQNQTCTLTAKANPDYEFVNWTENGKLISTKKNPTLADKRDRTLVANFKKIETEKESTTKQYTVTVTWEPSEGGEVEGGGIYDKGKTCNLKATPKSGYNISHWTDNGKELAKDQLNYGFTNVNEDHEVVAHFKKVEAPKPLNKITVTAEPSEGGTVNGGGSFEEGKKITLKATPKNGYVVKSWTKDEQPYDQTGNEAIEITVTKDATFKVHFELKDSAPKIKIPTNPNDSTTIDNKK